MIVGGFLVYIHLLTFFVLFKVKTLYTLLGTHCVHAARPITVAIFVATPVSKRVWNRVDGDIEVTAITPTRAETTYTRETFKTFDNLEND